MTPIRSPATASIFGNGGGPLPESNSVERSVDLIENSISMFDGGDGIFNKGDYFLFYGVGVHSWNYTPENSSFNHIYNVYNEKTFYFES